MSQQAYYKSVIGVSLTGGDDGQWQPWARSGSENHGDFSPAGVNGFRQWLKQKYVTPEKLQQAWHDTSATFEAAEVPGIAARREGTPFFDPRKDAQVIDYLTFDCESKSRLVARLAKVVKNAAGKDFLVGCYFQDALYGRSFSYEESPRITSDDLDFFVSPLDYGPTRRAGWVGGEFSAAPDTLRLHKKLYLCELDFRTSASRFVSNNYDYSVLGRLESKREFDSVNLRATGIMLNYGMGQWYYDLASASFTPQYAKDGLAKTVDVYKQIALDPTAPRPDLEPKVAVFADGRTNSYVGRTYQRDLLLPSLSSTRASLFLSGVTCAIYDIEDLTNPALPDYQVYVFLNSWHLDQAQRDFIESHLKKNGKTLVWVHAAGYLSDDGASDAQISAVTGMNIACRNTYETLEVEAAPAAPEPFDELLPRQGVAWEKLRGLRFVVEDTEATPIGRYSDTKEVANAVKTHPEYKSVFVAAPGGLGPDLLNAIVRYAGLIPTSHSGNVAVYRNSLLTLHGVAGGPVKVSLPQPASLTDLSDGAALPETSKEFTIDLNPGQTRLFKVRTK
jgi:hypothetical protein